MIVQCYTLRHPRFGAKRLDIRSSLENYAALLRKTGRADEATEMEGRAKAIRAKLARENPVE